MRILVVCGHRRHVGGVERYLEGAIAGLAAAGHELAMLAQRVGSAERAEIALPHGVASWVAERDADALRHALAWRPDVAYLNGVEDETVVAALQAALPTVYFAHDYNGCCISGFKTWQSVPRTCARPLGVGCLAHYYPHRCGGLDPVTALTSYRVQRRRRAQLARHAAVVSGSRAMLEEMRRQGVSPARTHFVPYFVPAVERADALDEDSLPPATLDHTVARLLFVGRVDRLKGGPLLLDALPTIATRLGRRVQLDIAGDGPDLAAWRGHADRVTAGGNVDVAFHGWTAGPRLEALWQASALLVVPSIWPEPFGLVGAEAGSRGVPAAAFAVGGIPEWLTDGENGHLADGAGELRAEALAEAVVRCLAEDAHWQALRRGAVRLARRFQLRPHAGALAATFTRVVDERRTAQPAAVTRAAPTVA